MSAHPILTGGAPSNQSIYEETTAGRHSVGTRASLPDGRVFYYARNGTVALGVGKMLMAETVSADFGDEVVGAAAAVGDLKIYFDTAGTKTAVANEFAEGYIVINEGTTGLGQCRKIKSHAALEAATDDQVINLYDPVAVAIDAGALATLVKNMWADVIITTDSAHLPAGVPCINITAGTTPADTYYFWCQTWGVAAVWQEATPTIGDALHISATAGQVVESAAVDDRMLGQVMDTGQAGDYQPTFLTIAP